VITYADYAERMDAITFYDLYDLKDAEAQRLKMGEEDVKINKYAGRKKTY
jgi:hypothetical protein